MDWIYIIENDDFDTYPKEGIDVLVSDGEDYDVAYYLRSGEYKWMKTDLIQDDAHDFKQFIITKWR